MKEIIGRLLTLLVMIYLIMITLRIFLSWLSLPRGRFTDFICRYTDPVLDFFRKNTPIQVGIFDVSIIIPIGILYIILQIIGDFMIADTPLLAIISVFYVFKLVLIIVRILVSLIMFLFIVFTIVLIVIKLFSPNTYNPLITSIGSVIMPIVDKIRRILKLRSRNAEVIYLFIVLGIFIAVNIALGQLLAYLSITNEVQLIKYINDVRSQRIL